VTTLIAIDTATEACSLALCVGDELRVSHQVIPRQHQQQLFTLLDELLDGQRLPEIGLEAVAFGCGPGSFTGLRIAASFAQGLAFSLGVPVIGVSTLETQAATYLRTTRASSPCLIASTIDARVGEIYGAFFEFDGNTLGPLGEAVVAAPEAFTLPSTVVQGALPLHCVGSGFLHRDVMTDVFRDAPVCLADILPEARDMLALASTRLAAGEGSAPASALPDYVQHSTGWKTLAEQGKRA
jgi:tRNA threonylcarbamoyladenosine biosynthesis protein TsaB